MSESMKAWMEVSVLADKARQVFGIAKGSTTAYTKWAKKELGWSEQLATRMPLIHEEFKGRILADHYHLVDMNCMIHLVRHRYCRRGTLSGAVVKRRLAALRKSYIRRINDGVRVPYETFRWEIYDKIGTETPGTNYKCGPFENGITVTVNDPSGKMRAATIIKRLRKGMPTAELTKLEKTRPKHLVDAENRQK